MPRRTKTTTNSQKTPTGVGISDLFANFVATGNAYKKLAKEIRYEDGDLAAIRMDELKREWLDAAWLLHEKLANTKPSDA